MAQTRRHKHKHILTGRRPSLKKAQQNAGANSLKAVSSLERSSIYTTIVPTFLHMLNTVKLYHWNITNFAAHKASDELYSKLNEKIDEFVEVMLGKPEIGRASGALNVASISLQPVMEIKKQIETYKIFLLDLSKNTQFNISANVDLLAIRDELLAALNQFLYLLTLN
jgi:DNA-binding ferritin-like protein